MIGMVQFLPAMNLQCFDEYVPTIQRNEYTNGIRSHIWSFAYRRIELTPNQSDAANAEKHHPFCVAKAAPLPVVVDRWC